MKLKLVGSIAIVLLLSAAAFSQANTSPSALPPAPGSGAADAAPAPALNPNATKVAAINVEGAIFATNEGQRDMGALQKKFEPRFADLKAKNDEIEALKKQLTATGITDEKKADINRQVEQKQKVFDRSRQDLQDDAQGQQGEIGQRIFQKLGPVIVKYAQDNNIGMLLDTSTQWPQGPVLYAAPLDITQAIVNAYNVQSGVPAPAVPASTTKPPASTRPSAPANKPATTTPPAK